MKQKRINQLKAVYGRNLKQLSLIDTFFCLYVNCIEGWVYYSACLDYEYYNSTNLNFYENQTMLTGPSGKPVQKLVYKSEISFNSLVCFQLI